MERFSELVANFTSKGRLSDQFTGPLSFLNSWQPINNRHGLLTGIGATTMFAAGNSFWNQYGRTLYNASTGQLAYNPNFPNGTARPPVILRTTNQSRMHNSQINWALGFFGSTTKKVPNPLIENTTRPYEVVVIPEGGNRDQNNTLASYNNCFRASKQDVRSIGNTLASRYMLTYLEAATKRLQNFAPADFKLGVNDTFAMQNLCAYEHAFIGQSEFCGFFTEDEWAGFEHVLDIKFYYSGSFGNPLGRAFGIGYVEELLARLNHSLITTSSSSVNSTLDSDPATFPTDQPFFADFTHDIMITGTLAALCIDYFRDTPSLTQFPPNADRKFRISKIAPFGARLVTETIGCSSANPSPRKNARIQYSPSQ
ncbi:hypothetical protein K3495_g1782 [Podosphaera aphanis]|nr:hypothetical protein K3495_g1782 [Podosphaera aphanis]